MANRVMAGSVMVAVGVVYALWSANEIRLGVRRGSIITSQNSSSSPYREYSRVHQPLRFRLALLRHGLGTVIGMVMAAIGSLFLLSVAAMLITFTLGSGPAAAQQPGPGFDCSKPGSRVRTMICGSPELAALDARLNEDFKSLLQQGGIAGTPVAAQLQGQEDKWRIDVRDRCQTVSCLRDAYLQRQVDLRRLSAQRSSPAFASETGAFPASPAEWRAAQGLIGASCASPMIAPLPGTSAMPRSFAPILQYPGMVITVLRLGATPFAFLLVHPADDFKRCTVGDVVALPQTFAPAPQHTATYACALKAVDGNFGLGLGRTAGTITAYWSIDRAGGKFMREPLGTLGGAAVLSCREPEASE